MKFHYSLLLIFLMLFTSCYNVDKPKKPSDLLSEEEMVVILVDMAMMSSAKGVNKKKLEASGIIPDEYIFKKHAIDSARFNTSNNYYAYDTDAYTKIYGKVKDSLTQLRVFYKDQAAKEKKEKAKRDSIKKIERKNQDSLNKLNPNYKKPKFKGVKSIKSAKLKKTVRIKE